MDRRTQNHAPNAVTEVPNSSSPVTDSVSALERRIFVLRSPHRLAAQHFSVPLVAQKAEQCSCCTISAVENVLCAAAAPTSLMRLVLKQPTDANRPRAVAEAVCGVDSKRAR